MRVAIIGASARAAAFSAIDAGWEVVTADLFADADLAARCDATRIACWPDEFEQWFHQQQVDGWLYTGGLENYPELVDRLAGAGSLWGNRGEVLRRVRSPLALAPLLAAAGSPVPETHAAALSLSPARKWLAKSPTSAGGLGVTEWSSDAVYDDPTYYQQRIDGRSISAAFVAAAGQSVLLGVTEQLVGRDWTRAGQFQYAGSIGPLDLEATTLVKIRRAGETLAKQAPIVGLFGIDFVIDAAGTAWLVDVNPRYTASMEIVERISGETMMAMHLAACQRGRLPDSPQPPDRVYYGKAYLFAREEATIGLLDTRHLADIPVVGTIVAKHAPVATVFAKATRASDVEKILQQRLQSLEKSVFS